MNNSPPGIHGKQVDVSSPTASPAPTLLVLDPSCAQAHGHHLTSLIDLATAVRPTVVQALVNRRLPEVTTVDGLVLERRFTTTVYDEPGIGPRPDGRPERRIWKLQRSARQAGGAAHRLSSAVRARMSAAGALAHEDYAWSRWRGRWPELARVLAEHRAGPTDHIVLPTADAGLIAGTLETTAHLPALAQALVHARIINPSPELAILRPAADASPAHRQRMEARLSRLRLYVETEPMRAHVASRFGLDTEVYPYLLSPPAVVPAAMHATAAFGYFGGKRNEKGFNRLPAILARVARGRRSEDPPISVFIHASDVRSGEAERLTAEFDALAQDGLAITFKAGAMDTGAYAAAFAAVDAVLLPYTGARYVLSGSGIVCEAISMGKALVMSEGLSFASLCQPDHALTAADDERFADAMLAMARDIGSYRAAAVRRADGYHAEVRRCPLLVRMGA